MGEDERIIAGRRRTWLIAAVGTVVVLIFLTFAFRSCKMISGGGGDNKYTVIYRNLDLKDTANVATVLKGLKISYKLSDNGRTVAVLKENADAARLGLAEKNLPAGGVVGWEIFNEAKLGATDFDRRVQFVRAISGELSRTIKQIEAVDDARVQIVIPKTELFAAATAPVTASVLLQLKRGRSLTKEQVNGIVHLVASSVENLRPENVTIVDVSGYILTVSSLEAEETALSKPISEVTTLTAQPISPEAKLGAAQTPLPFQPLSVEEKLTLIEELKDSQEKKLSSKAQKLLNEFYPPNSVIIKVNADVALLDAVQKVKVNKDEIEKKNIFGWKVKKLSAIVLVDNRLEITRSLKHSTFDTIASAIGYDKKRGDIIKLHQVPFHYTSVFNQGLSEEGIPLTIKPEKKISLMPIFFKIIGVNYIFTFLMLVIISIIVFMYFRMISGRRVVEPVREENGGLADMMKSMREIAAKNPKRTADLVQRWLEGEK